MPPALFEPSTYLGDSELLERISNLESIERAAFAEKLIGTLNKLVFYAVKSDNKVSLPDPKNLNLIPRLESFPSIRDPGGERIDIDVKGPYFDGKASLTVETARVLRLVDGRRSLDQIREQLGMRVSEFDAAFGSIYPFLSSQTFIQLSTSPWAM